ncbi:MAG: transposase, partial [Anaerolineaceae bacterium]|nr:transposase [Anaerolineaceae bacterium]
MISHKDTEDGFIYNFRLEEYVPKDHLLRIIDEHIDFEFIRDRVKHLYSHTGKPSIDPVVMIKMLLIGYLVNVKSERQLEKEIQVNLAYRWFIKYGIDEKIPDHSTISQTRRRKFSQSTVLQDVFDEVVKQCIKRGLVKGETILTDSTSIKANASLESLREIVITPQEYITQLEENCQGSASQNGSTSGAVKVGPVKRYSNETHRSSSDPDSRILKRKGKEPGLYYAEHRSIDVSGYITDVYVTAGTIHGDKPYINRLNRQQCAYGYRIRNVVADRQYGTGLIYKQLTDMGIEGYIPELGNKSTDNKIFSRKDFIHDREIDVLICPAGRVLNKTRRTPRKKDNCFVYRGSRLTCGIRCDQHDICMKRNARYPKEVHISIYQDYVDGQTNKKHSATWKTLLRKRKTLLEGSFGDAKNNHGLRRAKYRGIDKVQEQSLLTAIVQNLKKLAKDLKKS